MVTCVFVCVVGATADFKIDDSLQHAVQHSSFACVYVPAPLRFASYLRQDVGRLRTRDLGLDRHLGAV
jgi:hypothetical protein